MATNCFSPIRGIVWRLTRLDECGVPVVGPASTVTGKFVSIAQSPQYEASDPIRVTAADGDLCVNEPGITSYAQTDITIVLCNVDPDAVEIMTGAPVVLDAATPTPNRVGNRMKCGRVNAKFALEIWTEKAGQSCVAGVKEYIYQVFPLVQNAQRADDTIENAAQAVSFTASAFCNSAWGVGPYDVVMGAGDVPGPLLTPFAADENYDWQVTTVPPPAPSCGAVALAA